MPSFHGNTHHCVGATNRRFGRDKKTREEFSSTTLTPQSATQRCADHHIEIDPLHTPPVMKCRSCGAAGGLSNAEIR